MLRAVKSSSGAPQQCRIGRQASSLLSLAPPRSQNVKITPQRFYSESSPVPKACTAYLKPTHLDDSPPKTVTDRLTKYGSVTLATYARPPFILSHGKKCTVWDTEGRQYLDFSGGIAVNALGHADEGVQKVISEQSGKLVHSSNLWHNEWAGELALLLVESTKKFGGLGFAPELSSSSSSSSTTTNKTAGKDGSPESTASGRSPASDSAHLVDGAAPAAQSPSTSSSSSEISKSTPSAGIKVFFSNSGTEANEGALKFARKWGKQSQKARKHKDQYEIVSFKDGFHGRSFGALSATWQEKYQKPFAPLLPGFIPGELNSDYATLCQTVTEQTCGVIVEPIQGEGGILEAKEDFLRMLRKRCDEVGALLIFDEIQCGLGRTGSLWAHGTLPLDCHPDIVTMAKPLANGVPVGAIIMKDKVADIIKIGDHGTTFGGGPLQTRVAHHVLSRIAQPDFLSTVRTLSSALTSRLESLPSLFPRLISGPPRGRGLILGLPFHRDVYASRILKLCRERGVLLLSCGKSTIRFVPSLIVTEEEIEKCVDVLESSLVVLNREAEGM